MKKIRPSSVSGQFYPEDRQELVNQIKHFIENNKTDYQTETRAIIVPHAGYVYSAQTACEGFQYLDKKAKNVFIIAPAHYIGFKGIALSSFEKWATPLGEIELNQEINRKIAENFDAEFFDESFKQEHSIEVQLPFVQTLIKDARIIPILTNNTDYKEITRLIAHFWDEEDNVFVVSSDLSHFHSDNDARKIDRRTAEMIETQGLLGFHYEQACGLTGIMGLIEFAKQQNYSLIRISMTNSAATTNQKSRVVGYGSWFLSQSTKEKFIKDNFSDLLIDVCKQSIQSGLSEGKPPKINIDEFPAVLQQSGASFVTLEIGGMLRGCIGSIIAQTSLIEDINQNAFNSAFSDPRFAPLSQNEFNNLEIAVSLLSAPSQMYFDDEEDLLNQIEQDVDGLIIRDGRYQAVYLPSVWEQLPDKALFLSSLKQKAGMKPTHFSNTFEAYRFRTEYIKS